MNKTDKIVCIIICTVAIIFGAFYKLAPVFYYQQGQSYLKTHEYLKSYNNFKKAYTLNKKNKDYRYYYVKSMYLMPNNLTIQKEMFAMAAGDLEDSAQLAAQEKINEWRQNILNNIGENYIEQTPIDNGIVRWDSNNFPIKLHITENELNVPDYYNYEIKRAFLQWQKSTGFITFKKEDDENAANIVVEVVPLPENICSEGQCKYVVGYTTPSIKGHLLEKMVITLYATDPVGNYFSDKELYNTVLHEIGHALGIMGHSYNSGDLMYMTSDNNNDYYAQYRSSFQYLSQQDINTIKLLYKLVPNITNTPLKNLKTKGLVYAPIVLGTSEQIAMRKLKEAQNYIKKAPKLAIGYIDLAFAYAELNNVKEATKALKKAYELAITDNEKYLALYNLSVINYNNKKYQEALQYAQKAKEYDNSNDVKELIFLIEQAKFVNKK